MSSSASLSLKSLGSSKLVTNSILFSSSMNGMEISNGDGAIRLLYGSGANRHSLGVSTSAVKVMLPILPITLAFTIDVEDSSGEIHVVFLLYSFLIYNQSCCSSDSTRR